MDAAFVPPRIPSDAPRPGSRGHQTRRSTASTDSTETVTTPPTSPDKLFFFEYSSPASSETSNESSIGCGDLEAKVPNCNLDASVSVAEGSQSSNQPQEGSVQPQPRIAKSRNSDPLQPLSKRINPGLALDLSSIKSAVPRSLRCPSAPRIGCLPSPACSAAESPSELHKGYPSRPHPVSRFSDDTVVTASTVSTPVGSTSEQSPFPTSPAPNGDQQNPESPFSRATAPNFEGPNSVVQGSSPKRPKGHRPPRLILPTDSPHSPSEPITPRTMGALEALGVLTDADTRVPPTRRLRASRSFPIEGAGPSMHPQPRSPLTATLQVFVRREAVG